MSTALIVLGGTSFIALSIFFQFTPKLRVIAALIVGSKIAGATTTTINKWLAKGFSSIAKPVGEWIGQSENEVKLAIPGTLAMVMGIIIVKAMFGKGSKSGKTGKSGGKSIINIALGCAFVLPITIGGLAAALAQS